MTISSISRILYILSTTIFLIGFKAPLSTTAGHKEPNKAIWSIPAGIGMHWKPKAEAATKNSPWIGFLATTGVKWEKLFAKRYTFSSGLLWGLFLPDMFLGNKPTTWHGTILWIKVSLPYNLASLIPMTSLQLGCFINRKWHFSCGLVYLCGLECNVNYLILPKISLNGKVCFFLDKWLQGGGIHLGFATIGLDYRLLT